MKALFLIFLVLIARISFAQTTTILFLDKSASVTFSSNEDQVKSAINNSVSNFRKNGDRMFAYYIHDNTAGAGATKSAIAKKFTCSSCSNLELNNKKNQYSKELSQESANFGKACYSILMDQPITSSSKGTDIFGTLVVLSKITNVGAPTKVFLFSDMVHDAQGKKVNPTSKQTAQAEAIKDVAYVKSKYDFDPTKLKGITLNYILPSNPAESNHNQHLDTYWAAFFKEFGIIAQLYF